MKSNPDMERLISRAAKFENEPRKVGKVERAMMELDGAQIELQSAVNCLQDRLYPILMPAIPAQRPECGKDQCGVPIVDSLESHKRQIQSLTLMINELIERCEL